MCFDVAQLFACRVIRKSMPQLCGAAYETADARNRTRTGRCAKKP